MLDMVQFIQFSNTATYSSKRISSTNHDFMIYRTKILEISFKEIIMNCIVLNTVVDSKVAYTNIVTLRQLPLRVN